MVGALGVTTVCVAAWHEPGATLVKSSEIRSYCPVPPVGRSQFEAIRPDQDLLLLLYGLSQGPR